MVCLHAQLWATCMPGAQRGRKKALDPLGLELQKIISYHMDTQTQSLNH